MEKLIQTGSLKTPTINFDFEKGLLEISGKSIPEDAVEFYAPLYEWIDGYSESPKEITQVNLYMEYFNTSSSKEFFRFFKKLELLKKSGKTDLIVDWYYEEDDEEMLEMGISLNQRLEISINLKEHSEV